MYSENKVVIIGSGLGALSTALRLHVAGYRDISIIEKYHQAGGRLNEWKKDGYTFDMGPSFFSMSYEFKELFESCGIENPIEIQKLDPLYTVNFEGENRIFSISSDFEKLKAEFENLEPNFLEKLEKYLKSAGEIFHDTEKIVVKSNFDSKLDYILALATVPLKHTPALVRTMWTDLEKQFSSYEVKVILSLVSFFLGAAPFNTPAVYKLLSYTELKHDGYWNVKGGMYDIVRKLVAELEKRGVKFYFNTEIVAVTNINNQKAIFIDNTGKEWPADIYVVNSDAAAFRGKVLGRKAYTEEKLDKMEWTLAPFTVYLGIKGKIPNLSHHSYFLGKNFLEYSNYIFSSSETPRKPYYYVNVSSKSNPNCAPEGCENLFILCPVPDLRIKNNWDDAEELSNIIIDDLGKRVNFDIASNIEVKRIMTPVDWQNNFNLYKGSGLGLAHGLNQVGGFRPRNKDEEFSNVYYVGASTIPGTGLPMVIISSKLVVERINNDVRL